MLPINFEALGNTAPNIPTIELKDAPIFFRTPFVLRVGGTQDLPSFEVTYTRKVGQEAPTIRGPAITRGRVLTSFNLRSYSFFVGVLIATPTDVGPSYPYVSTQQIDPQTLYAASIVDVSYISQEEYGMLMSDYLATHLPERLVPWLPTTTSDSPSLALLMR